MTAERLADGTVAPARPKVSDDWGVAEWEQYRAQQAAAVERFGEPWASNIGRALVAMADYHLARLRARVEA